MDRDDNLDPVRGIINGIALGAMLWLVAYALWELLG